MKINNFCISANSMQKTGKIIDPLMLEQIGESLN